MKYEKKLLIFKKESDYISHLLSTTDSMSEDDTIIKTAKFDNGIEMDIKLCGAQDDYPWTEAVLFNNGSEVCCSEVSDEYVGEWELEYNGNQYVVYVEVL